MLAIPFNIAIQFFGPELNIALWYLALRAPVVLVPETTVYKNDCLVFRKNNIRFSWQTLYVLSKSISQLMEDRPYDNFRISFAALNPRHFIMKPLLVRLMLLSGHPRLV